MSTKTKKAATKSSSNKGKRYTPEQKAEIVAFVESVNAEKGRGGQSAASKKFKISPLTIASWLKSSGKAPKKKKATRGRPGRKPKAAAAASTGSLEKKLAKLASIAKEIDSIDKKRAKLQSSFDALKASL